jgi:CTP:molybdopterin cytidylyltransferase MocA
MGQPQRIVGIVLAAGQSSRMGRSKPLLPCVPSAETFVARVVRVLREGGVPDVVVVGRPEDAALRAHVDGLVPTTTFVENRDAARGQLTSLIVGIDHAQLHGADAVVVMPVDIPQVKPETVATLLAAVGSQAPIVRVGYAGRHGHPVLFREVVFEELRTADPAIGAKAVLLAHASDILNIAVDDPGVVRDVDVPDDYARLFAEGP